MNTIENARRGRGLMLAPAAWAVMPLMKIPAPADTSAIAGSMAANCGLASSSAPMWASSSAAPSSSLSRRWLPGRKCRQPLRASASSRAIHSMIASGDR